MRRSLVVLLLAVTVGCAVVPHRAPTVGSWSRKAGPTVHALSSTLGDLRIAAGDTAETRALCVQLAGDVARAYDLDPIPSAVMEGHWQSALAHLGQGARDCIDGDLPSFMDELDAASTEMEAVVADL